MKPIISIIFTIGLMAFPILSHAYVGPGAGLSAIGSIIAFVGALFLLIVGFLWYPVKRLIKANKKDDASEASSQENLPQQSEPQENPLENKEAASTSENNT